MFFTEKVGQALVFMLFSLFFFQGLPVPNPCVYAIFRSGRKGLGTYLAKFWCVFQGLPKVGSKTSPQELPRGEVLEPGGFLGEPSGSPGDPFAPPLRPLDTPLGTHFGPLGHLWGVLGKPWAAFW